MERLNFCLLLSKSCSFSSTNQTFFLKFQSSCCRQVVRTRGRAASSVCSAALRLRVMRTVPVSFQSVIPPAGSARGHLQTTVHPVPPRPACMRAAVSPAAHKAFSTRTTSVKVRCRTHISFLYVHSYSRTASSCPRPKAWMQPQQSRWDC